MSLEEELKEGAEHAHERGEKGIGLTMAIVAVLLALATQMGHRTHTEVGLLQGKIDDEWNFYQAKHGRAHEYGAFAELAALLPNGKDLALKDYKKSLDEECGTPVEAGCSIPAKDSRVLQSLLAPNSTEAGTQERKADKTETASSDLKQEKSTEATAGEHHQGKPAGRKPGAVDVQESAKEMEHERDLVKRRADFYDAAELFLEISIVLCSIALVAEMKIFWQLSFITTAIGVCVALWGFLSLHI